MTESKRKRELQAAVETIQSASPEERKALFDHVIAPLEGYRSKFGEPENRFDPYSELAFEAMSHVSFFFKRITGYDPSWAIEKFSEYAASNVGRPVKYDTHTRKINCFFITKMVERGASETQAMKLLMRLRGDIAESPGHMAELRRSLKDYKASDHYKLHGESSPFNADASFAYFLEFDIGHLEGSEKASIIAVAAFRSYFQELIDFMKEAHSLVAKYDKGYPHLFACVIDWIKAEYDDPLDYFFAHSSHSEMTLSQRRHALIQYVNAAYFFRDELGK